MFRFQVCDFPICVDCVQRDPTLLNMTSYPERKRVQMPDTANSAAIRDACTAVASYLIVGFSSAPNQVTYHRLCTHGHRRCLHNQLKGTSVCVVVENLKRWWPAVNTAALVDRVRSPDELSTATPFVFQK